MTKNRGEEGLVKRKSLRFIPASSEHSVAGKPGKLLMCQKKKHKVSIVPTQSLAERFLMCDQAFQGVYSNLRQFCCGGTYS